MSSVRDDLRRRFTAPDPAPEKQLRKVFKQRSDFKGERKRVQLRLPANLTHDLDAWADALATDRNSLIERVLAEAVAGGLRVEQSKPQISESTEMRGRAGTGKRGC
jgi:hypothetical protein